MTASSLGALVVLALVDGTSVGTLVIPVLMMLNPRMRARIVAVYLGVLTVFYGLAGAVLLLGFGWLTRTAADAARSTVVVAAQLAIGVIVFVAGLLLDRRGTASSARLAGWNERVMVALNTHAAVVIAVFAGFLELASMVPYLAALGMLAQSGLATGWRFAVLGGYVIVMVLPALVLLGLRTLARQRILPALRRVERQLARHASAIVPTVLIVAGFLLAGDAALRLNLISA